MLLLSFAVVSGNCYISNASFKQRSDLRSADICPQSSRKAPIGYNVFREYRHQIESGIRVSWEAHRYWFFAVLPTFGLVRDVAMNSIELNIRNQRDSAIFFSLCDIKFFEQKTTPAEAEGAGIEACSEKPRYTIGPNKTITIDIEQKEQIVANSGLVRISYMSANNAEKISHDIPIEEDWALCFAAINK